MVEPFSSILPICSHWAGWVRSSSVMIGCKNHRVAPYRKEVGTSLLLLVKARAVLLKILTCASILCMRIAPLPVMVYSSSLQRLLMLFLGILALKSTQYLSQSPNYEWLYPRRQQHSSRGHCLAAVETLAMLMSSFMTSPWKALVKGSVALDALAHFKKW